uniref:Uncharacterized protein n=1 Tax=Oryza meridionalis TaxID=40149 RepID=A0A0E0F6P3_9ORYZ
MVVCALDPRAASSPFLCFRRHRVQSRAAAGLPLFEPGRHHLPRGPLDLPNPFPWPPTSPFAPAPCHSRRRRRRAQSRAAVDRSHADFPRCHHPGFLLYLPEPLSRPPASPSRSRAVPPHPQPHNAAARASPVTIGSRVTANGQHLQSLLFGTQPKEL